MTAPTLQLQQAIEWGVAARALPGQAVSGDLHVVAPRPEGALIAVVDGLGHGDEATASARMAVAVIEQHAAEPVMMIVQHCHRALQRMRGVVMTVVAINRRDNTLTALGIGNVETVIVHADAPLRPRHESILLRGGVVGYQLPTLHVSVIPIAPGDMVVFATDGVREDFAELVIVTESPAQLAENILRRKFRGTDDGLVLACKYLGRP
jgi:serine phosphatase RsbU (regulator of sigma subunit)